PISLLLGSDLAGASNCLPSPLSLTVSARRPAPGSVKLSSDRAASANGFGAGNAGSGGKSAAAVAGAAGRSARGVRPAPPPARRQTARQANAVAKEERADGRERSIRQTPTLKQTSPITSTSRRAAALPRPVYCRNCVS